VVAGLFNLSLDPSLVDCMFWSACDLLFRHGHETREGLVAKLHCLVAVSIVEGFLPWHRERVRNTDG
jgi:hypothetical protein